MGKRNLDSSVSSTKIVKEPLIKGLSAKVESPFTTCEIGLRQIKLFL